MKLVNLTPHAVTLHGADNQFVTLAPSGQVARLATAYHEQIVRVILEGVRIPMIVAVPGEITGLPDPEVNTLYLVSAVVAAAAHALGRRDHVEAATFPPFAVRDAAGQIAGVKALVGSG